MNTVVYEAFRFAHVSDAIALFVGDGDSGRCRSVEKSKSRAFPPRLEIPQKRRDSRFSYRSCRDEQGVGSFRLKRYT
jgi:hypothetical protein